MENTEKTIGEIYTKNQIDSLKAYFKTAYLMVTEFGRYAPKSIDELMEIILKDKLEFADFTNIPIGSLFEWNTEDSVDIVKCFDRNPKRFDAENYLPVFSGKDVENGAWVKVRTTNGFEIHWAKKAKRVRRFKEEIEMLNTQRLSLLNIKGNDSAKEMHKDLRISQKIKGETDILYIYQKIKTYLKMSPYEVFIRRSKHKSEYFMPYQYEIINDVDMYIEAHLQDTVGLNLVNIFNADNEDQVFYLQSRGIPKRLAQVMGNLKNVYFKIDMKSMSEAFNNSFAIQFQQQLSA